MDMKRKLRNHSHMTEIQYYNWGNWPRKKYSNKQLGWKTPPGRLLVLRLWEPPEDTTLSATEQRVASWLLRWYICSEGCHKSFTGCMVRMLPHTPLVHQLSLSWYHHLTMGHMIQKTRSPGRSLLQGCQLQSGPSPLWPHHPQHHHVRAKNFNIWIWEGIDTLPMASSTCRQRLQSMFFGWEHTEDFPRLTMLKQEWDLPGFSASREAIPIPFSHPHTALFLALVSLAHQNSLMWLSESWLSSVVLLLTAVLFQSTAWFSSALPLRFLLVHLISSPRASGKEAVMLYWAL